MALQAQGLSGWRKAAGLTLAQAAKRARVCPAYLRRVECQGKASYCLAVRLSRIYGCPGSVFLQSSLGRGTLKEAPDRRRNRSGAPKER